jgi:ATP-dependent Zn protease
MLRFLTKIISKISSLRFAVGGRMEEELSYNTEESSTMKGANFQ